MEINKIDDECSPIDIAITNGESKGNPHMTVIVDQVTGTIVRAVISFYKSAGDAKQMDTVPIIEVATLDALVYEKDRTTVIGRPTIVLIINPVCGCVLRKAIVTTRSPSEALAAALLSWRPARSIGNKAQTISVVGGQEFRSQTFIEAAMTAGYELQYRAPNYQGIAERVMMHFTQRIKPGRVGNGGSTHLTFAEIKRSFWVRVVLYNKQLRKDSRSPRANPVYKSAGTDIPLSVRRAYFSVLQASLECGFDAEQVRFIWQTASYAYAVDELSIIFENVLNKLHSTKMYYDYYQADLTQLQSLFKPPVDILEGEGAVAIRTFASVKAQRDKKAFIWSGSCDWDRPVGSWGDFTNALLEKLVKDGLATDCLRCKLFARDLGL